MLDGGNDVYPSGDEFVFFKESRECRSNKGPGPGNGVGVIGNMAQCKRNRNIQRQRPFYQLFYPVQGNGFLVFRIEADAQGERSLPAKNFQVSFRGVEPYAGRENFGMKSNLFTGSYSDFQGFERKKRFPAGPDTKGTCRNRKTCIEKSIQPFRRQF